MPRFSRRTLVLSLAAIAALLVVWAVALRGDRAAPRLAADPAAAARIELTRGDDRLVLRRTPQGWVIASAGDAPANDAKVADLVEDVAAVRSTETAAAGSVRASVADAQGKSLGRAELAADELSLAPADWTTLQPPRFDAGDIRRVEVLSSGVGVQPDDAAKRRLAAALGRVGIHGFRGGDTVNWGGARYVQIALADGVLISAQIASAADGTWVRFNADPLPGAAPAAVERTAAIKALRKSAFRLEPEAPMAPG